MGRTLELVSLACATLVLVFGVIARARAKTERERSLYGPLILMGAGMIIGRIPATLGSRNTAFLIFSSIASMVIMIACVVWMRRLSKPVV